MTRNSEKRGVATTMVLLAAMLMAGCAKPPTEERIREEMIDHMTVQARVVGASRQSSSRYGPLTINGKEVSSGRITYSVDIAYGDGSYKGEVAYELRGSRYELASINIKLDDTENTNGVVLRMQLNNL